LALVLGSILLACSPRERPPPPPPPEPAKVDRDVVAAAFHECFVGSCERAYAHLSDVPSDSLARNSDEFHAVAYRYDVDRLLHADVEPDLVKRRAAFQAIFESKLVDQALRLAAAERIARMGSASVSDATEVSLNARADAAAAAAAEQAELQRKSRSKVPADLAAVRSTLEPRIFSGAATKGDVAILRVVCKAQRDAACLKQLDHLILR
jgi:hypothetical protein